jgi:hypothetical protein
MSKYFSNGES